MTDAVNTKSFIRPLSFDEAPEATKKIFEQLARGTGKVPNLSAAIGHSPAALEGILAFGKSLSKGELNRKENEAIALVVAQHNNCPYCLSAHVHAAQNLGFTDEQITLLRHGTSDDPKLAAVANLAREITATQGYPSPESVEKFYEAGYSRAALVELLGRVVINIFNNYMHHLSNTPLDYPPAPEI